MRFSPDREGRIAVTGLASVNGVVALRFEYLLEQAEDSSWRDDDMTISPDGRIELLTVHGDAAITAIGEFGSAAMTLHLRKARLDWTGADENTELDLAFTFDLTSAAKDPRRRVR